MCLSSLVMIKALKALQLFDVIIRKLVRQNVLLVNISKLRLSSHRICIDTARWARPQALPLYRRTCAQFFREGISDIMVMDFFYKKLRKSLIPSFYLRNPNIQYLQKSIELIMKTIPSLENLAAYLLIRHLMNASGVSRFPGVYTIHNYHFIYCLHNR